MKFTVLFRAYFTVAYFTVNDGNKKHKIEAFKIMTLPMPPIVDMNVTIGGNENLIIKKVQWSDVNPDRIIAVLKRVKVKEHPNGVVQRLTNDGWTVS